MLKSSRIPTVLGIAVLLFAATDLETNILAKELDIEATEAETLKGFFRKYCLSCHDDATATAKLSLEALSAKSMDNRQWSLVHDRLRQGQMPPKDELQPSSKERQRVEVILGQYLQKASLKQQQTEGRVVLRRLNRTEYETTLRDLLGKQVEVQALLPSDNAAAGFDKVSVALDVSSVHLLRFQEAAEKALRTVIPKELPIRKKIRLTGREVVGKAKNATLGEWLRLDGDTLFIYAKPYYHIPLGTATVAQSGRYVVRASVYAVGTKGNPMPIRFSPGEDWGRFENEVLDVLDAPPDKPKVVEIEFDLKARGLVDLHGWTLPIPRQFIEGKLSQGKPLDQYSGPGLAVEWLEIEGPLDPWPTAGYTRLFGDLPLKSEYKGAPYQVDSTNPRADAHRLMRSFLPLAFRRPVSPELQEYYLNIVLEALNKKQSFQDSMFLGYRAALCSPHFLFLTEPLGSRQDNPGSLDDYAVAARLSYFLWSSMPDGELIQLAAAGELTKPDVLRSQVERLLKHPKSRRFTEDFVGQWLDLSQINATTPDPQNYAEFDDFLYWSMPRETTSFVDEVLRRDLSIAEFVHSDWTFLNERLAKHYGIPDVFGGELRVVKLPPHSHRGGVITHASIMKVTADGTKTSPVLRGKWVLERILGQSPSPPPANVPSIEPDIRGATTIRQQLDKHRNIESCATCHRHIDPPGFALESFDVIGGWREFYRGTTYKRESVVDLVNYPGRQVIRGPNVESDGVTPDGKKFQNIDDYKQILMTNKDQMARNMAEKLLIYATGADIQFADREVVEQLVAKSREKGYGFRSLVHDVVQSRPFRNK